MNELLDTDRNFLFSLREKVPFEAFAASLRDLGYNIVGSTGTAKRFNEIGIATVSLNDLVAEPILDHLVVTLHPKVHAGLVAENTERHRGELRAKGYPWFAGVCVNLYPLSQAMAAQGATTESILNEMDLGGIALLRSASKGARDGRLSLYDPNNLPDTVQKLQGGTLDLAYCHHMAAKTDIYVAKYCSLTGQYRSNGRFYALFGELASQCLYGENPHQKFAALYRRLFDTSSADNPLSLDKFVLQEGKAPSFINWTDVSRALQMLRQIGVGTYVNGLLGSHPCFAVAVKHGNPCGAAMGSDPVEVMRKVVIGNPLAIMGGAIMANFPVTREVAEVLAHHAIDDQNGRRIVDVVVAPEITVEAIEILKRKHDKCRFLANLALRFIGLRGLRKDRLIRPTEGTFLLQDPSLFVPNFTDGSVEGFDPSCVSFVSDLVLGDALCRTSISNTIVLCKNGMLIGIGAGQQSRVRAAKLARDVAKEDGRHDTQGSIAVSDSFFPYDDGPQVLADAGVLVLFATSGSINDHLTMGLCHRRGVKLLWLPDKIARGFYGHG